MLLIDICLGTGSFKDHLVSPTAQNFTNPSNQPVPPRNRTLQEAGPGPCGEEVLWLDLCALLDAQTARDGRCAGGTGEVLGEGFRSSLIDWQGFHPFFPQTVWQHQGFLR